MSTKKLLIIDDEPDIVDLVSYNLRKEGFDVVAELDGERALDKIRNYTFDCIILDLMLPGIHGMDICRILKNDSDTKHIPIIMLSAKGEEVDKVLGLEMGADDYITKPFSPRELLARIKSVMRRTSDGLSEENTIHIGNLVINKDSYSVKKGNIRLNISTTEFNLFLYLVEKRGKVFSRNQLLDAVWSNEAFVEPRTVDVHIRRLRTQIEEDSSKPQYIKTRRGLGYYADANI